MRSDRERSLDILEAIEQIEKYAARGRKAFENDELRDSNKTRGARRFSTGFTG